MTVRDNLVTLNYASFIVFFVKLRKGASLNIRIRFSCKTETI